MKTTIIFPTYNEKENVIKVINAAGTALKGHDYEIIVVDDNSPDGTADKVKSLRRKNIRVIKRVNERGLVSAIQRGIDEAKGSIVVWLDCDMSHPPFLIPALVNEIRLNHCDIATASRYQKGGSDKRPFSRRMTSSALNLFAQLVLTRKIKDYTTGFVAAKKEVFNSLALSGNYGEYCVKFLYEAYNKGYRIREIPYSFTDRQEGQTKTASKWYSLAKHGWNYGLMVLKLRMGREPNGKH